MSVIADPNDERMPPEGDSPVQVRLVPPQELPQETVEILVMPSPVTLVGYSGEYPTVSEKVKSTPATPVYVAGVERKEHELNVAFAKKLATTQADLDVEKLTNKTLLDRLATEQAERAQLQTRIDRQERPLEADDRQEATNDERKQRIETLQYWGHVVWLTVACGLAVFLLIFVATSSIPWVVNQWNTEAVRSVSPRPDSISLKERLDSNPEIQKTRELTRRNQEILDLKGY